MAIKTVQQESLTAIADAIRTKTGGEEPLVFPTGMVEAIEGIEAAPPESAYVITGDCKYKFANGGWDWFINSYKDKITTKDITNMYNMFLCSKVESIPFDINMNSSAEADLSYAYYECTKLESLPRMLKCCPSTMQYMFYECAMLREIPEDYFDDWNFSSHEKATSEYSHNHSSMFSSCHSLRKLPLGWLKNLNKNAGYSYGYLRYGFQSCYVIDELVNLPLHYVKTWTSDALSYAFSMCNRLKNLTFETNEDGTPKVMKWKSQVLNLSDEVGWLPYAYIGMRLTPYNSGIDPVSKRIKDDATYQALKDDSDAFADRVEYSRYNHDSAVATINSLPDTSAYLATAGGTNTIKFKGTAGSKTDGGAINTLTDTEIAVAAAKGWTVTIA